MGQHDALKKYWQSSQYAETLQVVISEDGGRITNAIFDDAAPELHTEQ